MDKRYIIIDDDPSIRKMLELLIQKHQLGKVVCSLESGEDAIDEVLFYQPDIILIDMLLPVYDGIVLTRRLTASGFTGKTVMISQVTDRDMIAQAYEAGILFFVSKPINAIEVVSVLRSAAELVELQRSVSIIRSTLLAIPDAKQTSQPSVESQLTAIFRDLGLLGAVGIEDIQDVLLKIIEHRRVSQAPYQLKDIYRAVCRSRGLDSDAAQRTLEQRIRRTIQKALSYLAQRGSADYYDALFTEYAALLFDFRQVQQEIRHTTNPNEEQGKISTKKFMEGVLSRLSY